MSKKYCGFCPIGSLFKSRFFGILISIRGTDIKLMQKAKKSVLKLVQLVRTVLVAPRSKNSATQKPLKWLAIDPAQNGQKRRYYIKIKIPRWLLLNYLRVRKFFVRHRLLGRLLAIAIAIVLIFSIYAQFHDAKKQVEQVQLSDAVNSVIGQPLPELASFIKSDNSGGYKFNADYTFSQDVAGHSYGPKFEASFASAEKLGSVMAKDVVNKVGITITPKFTVSNPKKLDNRIVYPILGKVASSVYSMKSSGIKEDIVLTKPQGDRMSFEYKIDLDPGTEAKIEPNGTLAVYGANSYLLGNVNTSSQQDAELLQKARANAKKTNLLFVIPAPLVVGYGRNNGGAKAWFELKGNILTVNASGLAKAAYPLSIDPSIYVETAQKLMRGNNESNIAFDSTNELIKKGSTTGARINAWSATNDLNTSVWGQGTAVAGGYIYSVGGASGTELRSFKNTYYTAGSGSSLTIPSGVSTVTIKAWGAGGGGGAGSGSGSGGNGGGGGYSTATISVTTGDVLNIEVGTGGASGSAATLGGNGGGFSGVKRTGTYLIQAGGGGGGGASRGTPTGGAGGAGGGVGTVGSTSGVAGSAGSGTSPAGGGGRGTNAAGGAGGTLGGSGAAGAAGAANAGGNASPRATSCATAGSGTGGAGGTGAGGGGGNFNSGTCVGGGGGGGGRFGGGGGGGAGANNRAAGGGGGGSNLVTGSGQAESAGSGKTPGNSTDTDRSTAGVGGSGAATFGSATAGAAGAIVISYTQTVSNSTAPTNKVYWAKFNPTNSAIDSPNPGNGTCTSWCNNTTYDLPASLTGLSLVAYNGFLYAIGGQAASGCTGTSHICNTVYVAKIGANGEPQLWHPTGGTPAYWFSSANTLSAERAYTAVAAYNSRLYLVGGKTDASSGGVSTVQVADLKPTGDISAWSTTGMQSIATPGARFGHTIHVYNDVMYLIGGNASGTLKNDTWYSKINTDGTMNTWVQTNSFTTARSTMGGSFTAVWGGYIYLAGGCTAVDGSGYCTTIASDVRLASINADGSLAEWNSILNLTSQRVGHTLITWQGGLYRLGGCRSQNTGTGACDDTVFDVDYGVINQDGDASTVSNSSSYNYNGGVPIGGNPCSGYTSGNSNLYNCDLPTAGADSGQIGQMNSGIMVNNGYIYVVGGCVDVTATCSGGNYKMSGNTAYAALSTTGTIVAAATCPNGSYVGTWCVDNTHVVISETAIYNTGTICQSNSGTSCSGVAGTQIFGTGTTFAASHVGDTFRYADGSLALITARTSNTNITVNVSKVVGAGSTYGIYSNGIGAMSATVFNNTLYMVGGTDGTTWTSNVYRVGLNGDGSLAAQWTIDNTTATSFPGTFPNMAWQAGIGYGYAFTRANPASAGSTPGNLYYLGGCNTGGSGIGCNSYSTGTYKCNISTTGAVSSCTTTGQLQIDADPNITGGNQGLGLMAGAVYANYLYLIGGACTVTDAGSVNPCSSGGSNYAANRQNSIYAKIDNSNNIVAVSGGNWTQATGLMNPVRRRAVSFGYNGYIYSLAGYSGSASLQDLLFAKINVSTGDFTNFSSSGVVVTPRWDLRAIVSNGYVYAIGGCATGAAPTCTALQPQIQTFQLYNNDSGAVASYSSSANNFSANTDRWGLAATVYNGYIYAAGGCTASTCTSDVVNSVQYAAIDPSNGAIGTWNAGGNLPAARAWGKLVVAGNPPNATLYYVGGQDTAGAAQSTIYYTSSISSGNPTWAGTAATKGIGDTGSGGQARTKMGVASWNNRIYVVGGLNSTPAVTNTVYYSPDLTSGGNITSNWTSSGTFNVARSSPAVMAYANNLYIFGGYDGTNYLNDTQFASIGYKTGTITQTGTTAVTGSGTSWTSAMVGKKLLYPDGSVGIIQASPAITSTTLSVDIVKTVTASNYVIQDGSVGSWTYSTSLPGPLAGATALAANGYVYLIGGQSSSTVCTANTLVSPISANTTITSGNNPTGTGDWYETNIRYSSDRAGSDAGYANGKIYLLGGAGGASCNTPLTSNRHYYAPVKSQPQMAKYSYMVDTDTDVFPTGWLLNGIDNSVGAEWYLRYKSMHDISTTSDTVNAVLQQNPNEDCGTSVTMPTMTTWGQETLFGQVPLGTVEPYTALNGSGSNINCARYFYIYAYIDSSQAFGYPEDVSRGPTINDLSLLFTADPSKRLRHGKTFTGGQLQPLDTPCRISGATPAGSQPNCPLP